MFLPAQEAHYRYSEWLIRQACDETARIPTGLSPSLDQDTAGLGRGELAVVGAPFGSGKTTAGVNLAFNAAMQGFRVGYVTAEERVEEIRARVMARLTGIPVLDLFNRKLTLEQLKELDGASQWLRDSFRLDIASTEGVVLDDILQKLYEQAWRLDLLILDNLQAFGSRSGESRPIALEYATRSFRDLCKASNVAGVMLSQVSAEGDRKAVHTTREGKPFLDYMAWKPRWAGDVEGPADKLIYLFSWEDLVPDDPRSQGRMDVFLKKNRIGKKKQMYSLRVDFAKQFIGTELNYATEYKDGGLWHTQKRGQQPQAAGPAVRVENTGHPEGNGRDSGTGGGEPGGLGPDMSLAEWPFHPDTGEAAEVGQGLPF